MYRCSRMLSGLAFAGVVAIAATLATAQSTPQFDSQIVAFVSQNHGHGVPYGLAHDLGTGLLPELETLLGRDKAKIHWSNIVATIGFIGSPDAHRILHHFVHQRFSGEVDLATFQALIVAQGLLGHVAVTDSTVLPELVRGVNPDHWKNLPWRYRHYHGDHLSVLWSKLTINALAYSGTDQAVQVLRALNQKSYHPRQHSNIVEGLARIQVIRVNGLDAYERQRDIERSQDF